MTYIVSNGNIHYMKPQELTAWRENHGLNQSDLAKMLNVTRACISRWESDNRKIPPFLHITLKCLKVKKGGEKTKGKKTKKERR